MSALKAAPAPQARSTDCPGTATRHNLFVEIAAEPDALARVANLTAKLGILPQRFETVLDPAANLYEIRIETGTDPEQCEHLKHRLEGAVTVRQVRLVTLQAQHRGAGGPPLALVQSD